MPSNFSSTTLSDFYNDDYDINDNYHQILFNSGRALQARELTQLQTMIYQEISRFGRNVFKEGTAVSAGAISINSEYSYVQISSSSGPFEKLGTTSENVGIELGSTFTNGSGVVARILDVIPNGTISGIDADTIYVQYINSNNQAISDQPVTFKAEDVLTQGLGYNGYTLTVTEALLASPNAVATDSGVVGKGVKFDVADGEFFVLGRFVHADAQSLIISPYSDKIDGEIGFKVVQQVITVNDTTDLYDNSGGLTNTSSPGADRYKISLELVNKNDVAIDDTFVFLARIENSKIVEEVKEIDAYNKINNVLALRTNEESGNYIVNPFTIDFDSADADYLSLSVSAGIAYVNGYRAEISSPVELLVPRSIGDGETIQNDVVPIQYGNYLLIDSAGRIPDLDYNLLNLVDENNATLGTARARAIEPYGDKFKLYLFDLNLTGDFSKTKILSPSSISGEGYYFVGADSAELYDTLNNDLLFPTTRPRAASFSDMIITEQRVFTNLKASANIITINPASLGAGETLVDPSLWVAVNNNGQGDGAVSGTGNATSGTFSDPSLITNEFYDLYAYVQRTPTIASKSIQSAAITVTGSNGVYDLGVPDVDVVKIIQNVPDAPAPTNSGFDVSERFIFDDGQKDNFYENSKLVLKEEYGPDANPGQSADPGTIYVEYEYFARGSGDFYAPSSYNSVPYSRIPNHVLKDGTIVSLRNYIDYRPDKTALGNIVNVKALPRSGTNLTADITYHLPRADKLLVTQEGDVQLLMGQQSKDPQLKKTPDNSLEIYQVLMNANTANEDDVQIKAIEHKRYTMSDISKLDEKVEQLKQYTELNIAELRAYHTPSLDSAGDERIDAAIIVDDLTDQSGSDTNNDDYAASLDPENNLIRPKVDEDNVRLVYDAALNPISNGIVVNGDNVYLDYDNVEWQKQDLASRFINPNPFGVVDNVGVIKLSPSSDEWKDSKQEAIKAVLGSSKLDNKQAFLWNNWQWNWKGRNDEDVWIGNDEEISINAAVRKRYRLNGEEIYNSNPNTRGAVGYVRRVVRRDTLRQRIGNRIIDLALIPWMRSRKVYFKAQGLTPGTKFVPFFDGVDVSAWCKPETTFVRWAEREDDNGNQYTYNSLTGHPDTPNQAGEELISDANGEVIGSFWIPNLKPTYYVVRKNQPRRIRSRYLRFRAGIREFKLLDINTNDWSAANSKAFAYYSVTGAIIPKWNNIVSSRGRSFITPLGTGFAGFPSSFSPSELKQTLDAVGSANVNLVSPQVSGLYSPETISINPITYEGSMSNVISDYIYVNQKQFAGNNVKPLSIPQNPLSQTFFVDNQFGVTLSKINLFFHSKPDVIGTSDNMPISIHIRPVIDGKPSTTEIVPDSHVFMNPNQVDAIATAENANPTLSIIQSRPTEFTFEEPVFLQPWTWYAIVVSTQSTQYKLFSAKTLENVYGSTSRKVTSQPAPGALFLPQNGVAWFEAKDQDLMMTINRCDFTKSLGGGSLILRNGNLAPTLLDNNPIRLIQNSQEVYVKAPCSGIMAGDEVVIDSCGDISNIIADTYLNGPIVHTVTAADIHGFTFNLPIAADSDISGGGDRVLSQRNMVFDLANPNIETIIPNFTSVDMSAKFTTGVHSSGNSSDRFNPNNVVGQDMTVAKWQRVTPDQNIEFDFPRAVYHSGVQDTRTPNNSGLGGGSVSNNYSVYFKLDLKTSNTYVSPIVDLQRASLTLAGECIDNPTVANQIHPVDETQPSGGSTGSKHITTPVTTEIPGVGLDIRAEASLPPGSIIDCYYRTAVSDEDISVKDWVYQEAIQTVPSTGSNNFTELRFVPGGPNGALTPFQQSQAKFVMRGVNASPKLKYPSIRILAT